MDLFEGMDFVLSDSSSHLKEALPPAPPPPPPSKDDKGSPVHRPSSSEPLDEDLFSGLSMFSGSKEFETILSAYDNATSVSVVDQSPSKVRANTVVVTKSGRKKKKSVRIGYGRGGEDPDERESFVVEVESKNLAEPMDLSEFEATLVTGDSDDGVRLSASNSEVSKQDLTTESDVTDLDTKDVERDEETTAGETEVSKSPGEETQATEEILDVEEREGGGGLHDDFPSASHATTGEKLEAIKQDIARRLKDIENKAAETSALRKVAAQNRREAAGALASASARRKELELELESACEREDFELADRLSEDVAEAEKAVEVADAAFKEAELKYDSAAANMESVVLLKITIEEEGAEAVSLLEAAAELESEKVKTEQAEASTASDQETSAGEEALNTRRTQYESELKGLQNDKEELDRAIDEATEPEVQEKSSLLAEREVLVEELEELLAKVRAKESEIAKYDRSLEQVDVKIAAASATFLDRQVSLEADMKRVHSQLEALETEKLSLEEKRKQVEEYLATAEVEYQKLKDVAADARKAAVALRESAERKRKVAAFSRNIASKKAELVKMEEELLAESQALRQQASAGRASLQELSSAKVKLQHDISATKQRIVSLEKRGPELEAEKRLAAAARNFKEAARLSAEAKALLAEKETATGELQSRNSELQKLEEDIESKIASLADVESQIAMKEKEAARTCCERLRLVAVAARGEKDVALELEDVEEAESLEAEAAAADAEADELQRIHQFQGDQFEKLLGQDYENAA